MPWGKRSAEDEEYIGRQQIKLTCGVGGCVRVFEGQFSEARASLKRHRSRSHPSFVQPRRVRPGGFKKR